MRILLRRMLRRLILFLLLFLAPLAAAGVAREESPPPAGFYMAGEDAVCGRVAAHLLENGFTALRDPAAVEEQVQLGELDYGVVFPADLSARVAAGELTGCITVYTSPASYTPELWRNHVAAAVYREYAPYLTASFFEGTEVTGEEVLETYEAMFAKGYAFSFDVVTVSGGMEPEQGKVRSLVTGTAAVLLLVVVFALCAEGLESFRRVLPRLGLRKSVTAVLVPEVLLNVILCAVFTGAGLAAAGFAELALPATVYGLLLSGAGLFLAAVLRRANRVYTLLPLLVIVSVALCPVYTDLTLVIPVAAVVRNLLPAYWLWLIPVAPGVWAVIAAAAFGVGVLTVLLICRKVDRYRLRGR